MSGSKGIVRTFVDFGKAGYAVECANGMELIFSACEDFVRICLMSNIPNNGILGKLQCMVQGYGELYNAQVG